MASGLTWWQRGNVGLLIAGAVMAVGSIVFFVIAVREPLVRTSFLITGVVFILSSMMMLRLGWGSDDTAAEEAALLTSGVPARATIVSAEPTGTSRRGLREMRMQLRLEVPGKPPMLATKTDLVPEAVAPLLIAGRVLTVRSDPSNTLKIAIDWNDLGTGGTPWGQSAWPQGSG